jgi:hypothetical protein
MRVALDAEPTPPLLPMLEAVGAGAGAEVPAADGRGVSCECERKCAPETHRSATDKANVQ